MVKDAETARCQNNYIIDVYKKYNTIQLTIAEFDERALDQALDVKKGKPQTKKDNAHPAKSKKGKTKFSKSAAVNEAEEIGETIDRVDANAAEEATEIIEHLATEANIALEESAEWDDLDIDGLRSSDR